MLPVQEAIEIILNEVAPLGTETVESLHASGRVIAEHVLAKRANPPWDNSAMDGYAIMAADAVAATEECPTKLKVLYDLPAGSFPHAPVGPGEAVRIMTGAPVPDGADAVVMVERTEKLEESGEVLIKAAPNGGDNIRYSGEDFRIGQRVISAGTLIRPAEILMLAAVGQPEVTVYKRPVVAVLSTGDELVDIDKRPDKGQITNSNGYALAALAESAGCIVRFLGIARDTRESLTEKLNEAIEADAIITSGGVSVGDYDLVKDVLSELGSTMRFWKVALKPGKPLAFGVISGRPAFGLPGNPVSSMVAFEQFVRPALLKMAGREAIFQTTLKATITEGVRIRPGRMNFLRAVLNTEGDDYTVTPLKGQSSGAITTMVDANAYIIAPPDSSGFGANETVRVQPFDASVFLADTTDYPATKETDD
ncbi:MAG: molybdopterin molybdotransferase MoeA [Proteobacteria bacterium]|nr:molybdopterin molybdotransferase MoeA [Pseudomonadota bacterium]